MIREMSILPCNIDIYTSFLLIFHYILRKDNMTRVHQCNSYDTERMRSRCSREFTFRCSISHYIT